MLPRPVVLTGLLGAAVAAPIAMTEGPKQLGSEGFFNSGSGSSSGAAPNQPGAPATSPFDPTLRGPGSLIYNSPAPIEGVRVASLAELLRMDVTKEWVYARWARKSTGLAEPGLFGVRAPVVTGTGMADLAGSISYYFNPQGRVDCLRFKGRTADTRPLVAVLQSQYGLQPAPAPPGEQLLQARQSGKVISELRTRTEPVLWSTSPHESFQVDLELNRPGTGRYINRRLTPNLPPAEPVVAETPPAEPEVVTQGESTVGAETVDAGTEVAERQGPNLTRAQRPTFRWPN